MGGANGDQFCFVSHSLGTVIQLSADQNSACQSSTLFCLTHSGIMRICVLRLVIIIRIILKAEV
jgi:hypothetical protein